MALIKEADFVDSIADALQYISYYHPLDFIEAMEHAYNEEKSQAAKDAIAQILINSRMAAEGHRPICQDTGIVTCFVKVGMNARFESDKTIQQMVDEGVRRAYSDPSNPLRASIVADPVIISSYNFSSCNNGHMVNQPILLPVSLFPPASVPFSEGVVVVETFLAQSCLAVYEHSYLFYKSVHAKTILLHVYRH